MTGSTREVLEALKAKHGPENVCKGKASGFYIRNQGWISLAQARKDTGISAPPSNRQPRQTAYGDYAWFAGINRRLKG